MVISGGDNSNVGVAESSSPTDDEPDAKTQLFQSMFERLHQTALPSLCLLNGPALGGGVGLVFTCDLRVATDRAHYLALTECKRGLVPALISIYVVPHLPPSLALEMMMLGDRVGVEVFHRLGVINAIVVRPTNATTTTTTTTTTAIQVPSLSSCNSNTGRTFTTSAEALGYFTSMLFSSAPQAVRTIKQLLRRLTTDDQQRAHHKAYLRTVFQQMMQSEEAAYGMISFLTKQRPEWPLLREQQAAVTTTTTTSKL